MNSDISRRTALAAGLLLAAGRGDAQQAWPSKPIKLVVPFPPGGPTDIAARLLGQQLAGSLEQPVVIENRPGAGGTVGASAVAQAAADGYTLLFGSTSTLAVSPALYAKLPYDAATAFHPVALVARGPQMLVVNPSVPADNLKAFIAYAKSNPGKLSFSTAGIGSVGHLTGEMLKSVVGIDALHVPYKGGAPAINAVVAGETQFTIDAIGTMMAFVKAGKLKAIALLGEQRSALAPGVQTASEAGYKTLVADFWSGVVAPAGTPAEVVSKLAVHIARAVADPNVVEQLRVLGTEPQKLTPEQFTRFVRDESRKWAAVVASSGAKPE
jgi:tripartite-type tricarboxylate transporter receptor subunit TctC